MIVPALLVLLGGWTSWIDAREYRIPDTMISLGLLGIIGLCSAGMLPWCSALGGFALAGVQMGLVRIVVRERLGWGDVKYSLVLGGLLGPEKWISALLLSAAGALPALLWEREDSPDPFAAKIPFAPFLTAGGITASITHWSLL